MGTFTFCKYDDETLEDIWEWCHKFQIPSPTGKSKMHTTVIWSKTDISEEYWLQRDKSHFRKMEFDVVGLELFNHFSKRQQVMQKCLVIKLDAPYLLHCHNHLIKKGGTNSHPSYTPHITVCYNFPVHLEISKIDVPNFKFKPSKIFTENFVI